jgi:hypothetical protein
MTSTIIRKKQNLHHKNCIQQFSQVFVRSYRDISALNSNRHGLERVIRSSTEIYKASNLTEFINGVLEQLVAVLFLERDSVYLSHGAMAIEGKPGISTVLAGTGKYSDLVGKNIEMELMEKEKKYRNGTHGERKTINYKSHTSQRLFIRWLPVCDVLLTR